MTSKFNYQTVWDTLELNAETAIAFYKTNGELRDMRATLHVPTIETITGRLPPNPNGADYAGWMQPAGETHMRVFDLDKNEWRSFVFENLVTVEGIELEH